MKKTLLLFLFCVFVLQAGAQQINVEEARKLYPKSAESKDICKKLHDRLAEIDEKNQNLLMGYKGAVLAEMAKHEKDAPQKLKFFREGKRKLDQAILNDLENIELRFLRLSIQLHTPDVLRYNGNITSDRDYINKNIENVKNEQLRKSITDYMAKMDRKSDVQPK